MIKTSASVASQWPKKGVHVIHPRRTGHLSPITADFGSGWGLAPPDFGSLALNPSPRPASLRGYEAGKHKAAELFKENIDFEDTE